MESSLCWYKIFIVFNNLVDFQDEFRNFFFFLMKENYRTKNLQR